MNFFAKIKDYLSNARKMILSIFLVTSILAETFSFAGTISSSRPLKLADEVSLKIAENNKKNKYSFWTVSASEERNDWYGGDIKSWLYSLSNSWSVFDDGKHNHSFLVTFSQQNQTFARVADTMIPISVMASPTPSSLMSLKFKISDGLSFNGKDSFYISRSLYEKLGSLDCKFKIMSSDTDIHFDGIIDGSKSDIMNEIGLDDFIVIPTPNAYDMQHYTGKSTFVTVLYNDYYQNYFCINRFYYIDSMSKNMHDAYKASFLDKATDLKSSVTNIESVIQSTYNNSLETIKNNTKTPFYFICIMFALLTFTIVVSYIVIKKTSCISKKIFNYLPTCISLSLIIFFIIQNIAYRTLRNIWLIWSIECQIVVLLLGCFLLLLSIIIYLLKKRKENKYILSDDSFVVLDI